MNDEKDTEQIKCELCLKQVPLSEAHLEEAEDYVIHFCGLDCYDKWREQAEQEDKPKE